MKLVRKISTRSLAVADTTMLRHLIFCRPY